MLAVRPGECSRSSTAAVGTPPFQKNASSLPSFMASTACDTLRLCGRMSRAGSSPAVARMRSASTADPAPGGPVDTTLPFRPATDVMPLSPRTTRCV